MAVRSGMALIGLLLLVENTFGLVDSEQLMCGIFSGIGIR